MKGQLPGDAGMGAERALGRDPDPTEEVAEVVVIGAGVAGLTAALTSARNGVRTVVFDPVGPGGQILSIDAIEGYPGIADGTPGYELGPILWEQAELAGASFRLGTVGEIRGSGEDWAVVADCGTMRARCLIVATGSKQRSLGVEGEERFLGKGLSTCASCDGPLFAGEDVCVVGGGDSAVQEALTLAEACQHVVVVFDAPRPHAQATLVERLRSQANVEERAESRVVGLVGQEALEGVRIAKSGFDVETLPVRGVFAYVGLQPRSTLLSGLADVDGGGHVVTDLMLRTSVPGIFAAGDVRSGSVALLAAVAGDGATAAVGAVRYLLERKPA